MVQYGSEKGTCRILIMDFQKPDIHISSLQVFTKPGASFTMLTLGKIPCFCKILDPKIKDLKKIVDLYFCLVFAIIIKAWHSKVKTITLVYEIVCIS
jgi:hypothetical protein